MRSTGQIQFLAVLAAVRLAPRWQARIRMAQKFNSLEEAAQQLGISKDRLSQLREAGKVRGYRDGASWKFRSDDIEKLAAEGIPTIDPPPSDIDLGSGLNLGQRPVARLGTLAAQRKTSPNRAASTWPAQKTLARPGRERSESRRNRRADRACARGRR